MMERRCCVGENFLRANKPSAGGLEWLPAKVITSYQLLVQGGTRQTPTSRSIRTEMVSSAQKVLLEWVPSRRAGRIHCCIGGFEWLGIHQTSSPDLFSICHLMRCYWTVCTMRWDHSRLHILLWEPTSRGMDWTAWQCYQKVSPSVNSLKHELTECWAVGLKFPFSPTAFSWYFHRSVNIDRDVKTGGKQHWKQNDIKIGGSVRFSI